MEKCGYSPFSQIAGPDSKIADYMVAPPQLPPTLVKMNASRRSLYSHLSFPSDSKKENPLWRLPLLFLLL